MILNKPDSRLEDSRTGSCPSVGVVAGLHICRGHRQPVQTVSVARALENLGLEGDRHALPDGKRQVLLMPVEVLERLEIPAGAVKENISTRGIDVNRLAPGTRLQVGEAVFELTKACTPCSRMDEIRRGLQDALEGQRGMLARVVRGGEVRVGDEIQVLDGFPPAQ